MNYSTDQNSPSCYRKTFCTMDWWTKDLEGSSSSWPFWDEPPRSVVITVLVLL
ncbi:hypothetical protein OIU76_002213 [Salix suchowensis]|nr:hypothetical protein OIU76_002213 [Salix suchowensis]KAJ6353158.1 hypothetical protein OIU76_002213 [Salix suchowensis]